MAGYVLEYFLAVCLWPHTLLNPLGVGKVVDPVAFLDGGLDDAIDGNLGQGGSNVVQRRKRCAAARLEGEGRLLRGLRGLHHPLGGAVFVREEDGVLGVRGARLADGGHVAVEEVAVVGRRLGGKRRDGGRGGSGCCGNFSRRGRRNGFEMVHGHAHKLGAAPAQTNVRGGVLCLDVDAGKQLGHAELVTAAENGIGEVFKEDGQVGAKERGAVLGRGVLHAVDPEAGETVPPAAQPGQTVELVALERGLDDGAGAGKFERGGREEGLEVRRRGLEADAGRPKRGLGGVDWAAEGVLARAGRGPKDGRLATVCRAVAGPQPLAEAVGGVVPLVVGKVVEIELLDVEEGRLAVDNVGPGLAGVGLDLVGAVHADVLVEGQAPRQLAARGAGAQQGHERRRVLDGHAAALALVRQERMGGVAEEGQLARGPGRQLVHVQERPQLQVGAVDERQQVLDGGAKLLVDVEQGGLAALAAPGALAFVFAVGRRRQGGRMEADKVEHRVVDARIHDEAAVAAVPHGHVAVARRPGAQMRRRRVVEHLLAGHEKAERTAARRKGLDGVAADAAARDGRHAVGAQDQVATHRRAVLERHRGRLGVHRHDPTADLEHRRRAVARLGRGHALQLVVQADAVAQDPRVLPHAAGAAQVDVHFEVARTIVLGDALQWVGAKGRRLDPESLEEPMAVGRQVDGGAGLLGELGALQQRDAVALGAQPDSSGQTANAGADNDDVEGGGVVRHCVTGRGVRRQRLATYANIKSKTIYSGGRDVRGNATVRSESRGFGVPHLVKTGPTASAPPERN
ncbi:hypothetical protein SPBR_04102 [Sporothrix brasiliensis 5110]|uniref:Uncharacterized protein n=1 Tax=Sporothrix brasiliensis 5110 TaxID=1398154 RepID=A0A0C2J3K7_9PEZI|nr:uncharacterized protein SPBR_04102 [Sporothrix brasiliensis 5110]KIH93610.1 hypothetical protein SPBR_04102 [Sporothrix brasiliensis 5110]